MSGIDILSGIDVLSAAQFHDHLIIGNNWSISVAMRGHKDGMHAVHLCTTASVKIIYQEGSGEGGTREFGIKADLQRHSDTVRIHLTQ